MVLLLSATRQRECHAFVPLVSLPGSQAYVDHDRHPCLWDAWGPFR
jgi:hypothetical protein